MCLPHSGSLGEPQVAVHLSPLSGAHIMPCTGTPCYGLQNHGGPTRVPRMWEGHISGRLAHQRRVLKLCRPLALSCQEGEQLKLHCMGSNTLLPPAIESPYRTARRLPERESRACARSSARTPPPKITSGGPLRPLRLCGETLPGTMQRARGRRYAGPDATLGPALTPPTFRELG